MIYSLVSKSIIDFWCFNIDKGQATFIVLVLDSVIFSVIPFKYIKPFGDAFILYTVPRDKGPTRVN